MHQLMEDLDILDLQSSVQEILHEYDEKHKDVLKVHEEHKERNEGEMSMDEYMKFGRMLELQLLSPTLIKEPMDTSKTTCLGEVESICK
jgi:hypothetical protein